MAVISMWISMVLVFLLLYTASRRVSMISKGIHAVVEVLLEFIRDELVLPMMGKEGIPYIPFIATVFFFIWFCNLSGLIPGLYTPTSNINITATLAIIVFFAVHITGIRKHGFFHYFKGWVPKGVPGFLFPFLFIIEIPSSLAKPFSLALRLFANMFAGHVVLLIFLGMIITYKSILVAPFPVLGAMIIMVLELLFTALQAYIFAILSALYLSDAVHGGH